jgi:hypothetical protein
MSNDKLLHFPRYPQSDLNATRELCRQPGILRSKLQKYYWVIRDGKQEFLAIHLLTAGEVTVIAEVLHEQGAALLREADALKPPPPHKAG